MIAVGGLCMINMTWPQYLRGECTVTIKLTELERRLLSTLLVRAGSPAKMSLLIEAMWPDDDEPDKAEQYVHNTISGLRHKHIPVKLYSHGRGWYI